jgi:hypothetical protein
VPIYEYQHMDKVVEGCSENLELFQRMCEPPLDECPHCNQPVKKVISLPAHHRTSEGDKLSDANLKRTGFSKYVKSGDGTYEKAAGPDEAPAALDRNALDRNLKGLP